MIPNLTKLHAWEKKTDLVICSSQRKQYVGVFKGKSKQQNNQSQQQQKRLIQRRFSMACSEDKDYLFVDSNVLK